MNVNKRQGMALRRSQQRGDGELTFGGGPCRQIMDWAAAAPRPRARFVQWCMRASQVTPLLTFSRCAIINAGQRFTCMSSSDAKTVCVGSMGQGTRAALVAAAAPDAWL